MVARSSVGSPIQIVIVGSSWKEKELVSDSKLEENISRLQGKDVHGDPLEAIEVELALKGLKARLKKPSRFHDK